MIQSKKRLDILILERFPQYSRRQIQDWIVSGTVKVNGKVVIKPGAQVLDTVQLELDIQDPKYVSRAGLKLEKALDHFNVDVHGLVALDAGISTGGFTDCLLQRGIKKVYGIDVGHGQVHQKIKADSRVELYEKTNLRELKNFKHEVDLITLDLSFISVLKVMDVVDRILKKDTGQLIVLIKPQFEVGKEYIGRSGIIKDESLHQKVIDSVTNKIKEYNFDLVGVIESPILGTTGNKEFLAYFRRKGEK